MCICFLNVIKTNELCTVFCGQQCIVCIRCTYCQDWPIEQQESVSFYIDKLAEHHKRRKERKLSERVPLLLFLFIFGAAATPPPSPPPPPGTHFSGYCMTAPSLYTRFWFARFQMDTSLKNKKYGKGCSIHDAESDIHDFQVRVSESRCRTRECRG